MPTITPVDLSPISNTMNRLMDIAIRQQEFHQQSQLIAGDAAINVKMAELNQRFTDDPTIDPTTYLSTTTQELTDHAKEVSKDWSPAIQERFLATTQSRIASEAPSILAKQHQGIKRQTDAATLADIETAPTMDLAGKAVERRWSNPILIAGKSAQEISDGMSQDLVKTYAGWAIKSAAVVSESALDVKSGQMANTPVAANAWDTGYKELVGTLVKNYSQWMNPDGTVKKEAPASVDAAVEGSLAAFNAAHMEYLDKKISPSNKSNILNQVYFAGAQDLTSKVDVATAAQSALAILQKNEKGQFTNPASPNYMTSDHYADAVKELYGLTNVAEGDIKSRRVSYYRSLLLDEEDPVKRGQMIEKWESGKELAGIEEEFKTTRNEAMNTNFTTAEKLANNVIDKGVALIKTEAPKFTAKIPDGYGERVAKGEAKSKEDLSYDKVKAAYDLSTAEFMANQTARIEAFTKEVRGMSSEFLSAGAKADFADYTTKMLGVASAQALGSPLNIALSNLRTSPKTSSTKIGQPSADAWTIANEFYKNGIALNKNSPDTKAILGQFETTTAKLLGNPNSVVTTGSLDNTNSLPTDGNRPLLYINANARVPGAKTGLLEDVKISVGYRPEPDGKWTMVVLKRDDNNILIPESRQELPLDSVAFKNGIVDQKTINGMVAKANELAEKWKQEEQRARETIKFAEEKKKRDEALALYPSIPNPTTGIAGLGLK